MPDPNDYDNEQDFVSACIPIMKKEHPDWTEEHIQGACYGMWKQKGKHKKNDDKRFLLYLSTQMFEPLEKIQLEQDKKEFKDATILVGDGTYRGIFFPAEEIEKAWMTWEKQPINLDHSDNVEDEIGYLTNLGYDKNTKRLTARPNINDDMPNASVARAYINGRNKAGTIPEVSVGIWMDKVDEELKDGKLRLTARNLVGDHLALVTRGACSPQAGCGIGLSYNATIPIDYDYKTYNQQYVDVETYEDVLNEVKRLKMKNDLLEQIIKKLKEDRK